MERRALRNSLRSFAFSSSGLGMQSAVDMESGADMRSAAGM
jgi:hypothetical protein